MSKFDQVKRQIDRLDPHDLLASHAPQDEYDAESQKISARISFADSAEQIADVIAEVMQAAFGAPESPARYQETARNIRRALAYEHYGQIADLFEYGSESDSACIEKANTLILQTRAETDPEILEMMFHALYQLVTNRSCAVSAQLDLLPLTEDWQRFDAMSLEYLPEILAASGDPQYEPVIRQICAQYPQIALPE